MGEGQPKARPIFSQLGQSGVDNFPACPTTRPNPPAQDGPSAYSPASDWWALGVLTYELLYGRAPYSAPTLDGVLHRISHTSPAFTPPEDGGPKVRARGCAARCARSTV